MSRFAGNIDGKNINTYARRGNKRYSPEDIGRYLSKFKLCDALRLIGELSYKVFTDTEKQESSILKSVLPYLSMILIENSNDYRHQEMTSDNLLTAIDMYFGLPDPLDNDSDNVESCLIRLGSSQFDYNREARHLLPRTLIIYRDLWGNVANSSQVDINSAIQDFSGLNLQEILLLSFYFSSHSQYGFFRLNENIDNFPAIAKNYLDINKQQAFVNWIACSYQEFRKLSREYLPPSTEYDKFRFNPLHTKPIIIPNRNPKPMSSQVYITPIPILICEKVTRGLYFSLSDYFKNGRNNPFRGAFGSIFEEYVGLLLKKTFGEDNVQCQWKYGSRKQPKDTPDWFIIQNGIAVLIEVKHSGLYLNSKLWGELEQIQKDIKKTIGAGVNQMWGFESDIASGLCPIPDWFNNIQIVERLIITYDRSYFLNSILRDEVISLYPVISTTYHWHTISVEELEYFLGITGENFIEALKEKRLDPDLDRMDFRDYYSRMYSKFDCKNPYLDSIFDKYFNDLGFPSEFKDHK